MGQEASRDKGQLKPSEITQEHCLSTDVRPAGAVFIMKSLSDKWLTTGYLWLTTRYLWLTTGYLWLPTVINTQSIYNWLIEFYKTTWGYPSKSQNSRTVEPFNSKISWHVTGSIAGSLQTEDTNFIQCSFNTRNKMVRYNYKCAFYGYAIFPAKNLWMGNIWG